MFSTLRRIAADTQIRIATITLVFVGFAYAATLPYMSLIAMGQLGMSPELYSVVFFSGGLANVLAVVSIGALSDHLHDRRLIIMIAALVGGVGFGIFSLFPSVALLIFCMLLIIPIANSMFSLLFASVRVRTSELGSGEASSVNAMVRAFFSGSFILVPGLVGFFLTTRERMSDAFAVAGLAYAVCVLLHMFFAPPTPTAPIAKKGTGISAALLAVLALPVLVRVFAVAVVASCHWLNAIIFPLITVKMEGGTMLDVGVIAGAVAALEIPCMLAWGAVLKRQSAGTVIIAGGAIFSLYLLGLFRATETWHLYALVIPNAIGGAALLSVPVSYLQELMADRPGLGTSLLSLMTFAARGVSVSIFAFGSATLDLSRTALVSAIVSVVGCFVLFALDGLQQSDNPPDTAEESK